MSVLQPTLHTARLSLAPASALFADALLQFQLKNRAHLAPWDPTPSAAFFTHEYWQRRGLQREREWREGRCAAFVLIEPEAPAQLIGSISLSNIQRGVTQSAILGYSLDEDFQGQGLMSEAARCLIQFAFGPFRLHRLQANYQPNNQRSAALLARLGFVIEGQAKDYLYLNGAWRDHVLTALINPQFDAKTILV